MSKAIKIIEDKLGVTALDGIPVVSSRRLAEIFEKEHRHVLDSVRSAIEYTKSFAADFSASNFIQSEYLLKGRKYPEFLLTKDGFAFVAMGFTGEKAAKFKVDYINKFNQMQKLIEDRHIARLEYPELTEIIKLQHDSPKFYHFSNEADMLNKIILGATAKQYRVQHKIPKDESVRDYMLPWQVEALVKLQKMDIGLVAAINDIKGA